MTMAFSSRMVAGPITMAFSFRVVVPTVVILRVVKATLATFIEPRVAGSACDPGQGKAHDENDNPRHVWPTSSHNVTPKNRPSPGKFRVILALLSARQRCVCRRRRPGLISPFSRTGAWHDHSDP
jgi:hypothetical protein